jgi:hypothetical protein
VGVELGPKNILWACSRIGYSVFRPKRKYFVLRERTQQKVGANIRNFILCIARKILFG